MNARVRGRFAITLVLLFCLGALYSVFRKGGAWDFQIYTYSVKLFLAGRWSELYTNYVEPNHFLYAPGFVAWLSPIGLLPLKISFWIWTFLQILAILAVTAVWARRVRALEPEYYQLAWLAPILLARPLLYILTFGTVDFFLFAATFWALLSRVDPSPRRSQTMLGWAALTLFAIGKPTTVPILLIPWISSRTVPRTTVESERVGILIGLLAVLLPVWFYFGLWRGSAFHGEWVETLIARGMPIDTQNQSFTAFLFRWLTNEPVGALALGTGPKVFGWGWFSHADVAKIASLWTPLCLLAFLAWQRWGRRVADPVLWTAITLGFVALPSHIAWKAYYVFGLPVFGLAVAGVARNFRIGKKGAFAVLMIAFLSVNCSTFDFIGKYGQVYSEALSVFFWAHLCVLILAFRLFRLNRPV